MHALADLSGHSRHDEAITTSAANLACVLSAWGLATVAGCTALLGMDEDYQRAEPGAGAGGAASRTMGWRVSRGSVSGAEPYSLDVVAAGLTVGTRLLLSRGNNQAYTIDLPPNFVTDFDQTATSVAPGVTHVSGSCVPSGGVPEMLQNAGHTAKQNVFLFS